MYAIATTAAARRPFGRLPVIPMWTWCRAIDESVREYGSGSFWFQAGVAATISVVFCLAVALQLRCERTATPGRHGRAT